MGRLPECGGAGPGPATDVPSGGSKGGGIIGSLPVNGKVARVVVYGLIGSKLNMGLLNNGALRDVQPRETHPYHLVAHRGVIDQFKVAVGRAYRTGRALFRIVTSYRYSGAGDDGPNCNPNHTGLRGVVVIIPGNGGKVISVFSREEIVDRPGRLVINANRNIVDKKLNLGDRTITI